MVRASKVRLVESAVERTARLLSQQFGIRVIWKHGECKTNGKVIYLPTLPDDAPDDLLAAVHGYLDHETAHILFTDFGSIKAMPQPPTEAQMLCINVVEDVRIERKISSIFPGSSINLRASRDWLIPLVSKNWENLDQFSRACTAVGDFLGYGTDTDFWAVTVDDATKQLVLDCVQAIGPTVDLESTADCIAAGMRMWDVLKDFAPPPSKKKKSSTASEAGGSKSKAAAKGTSEQSDSTSGSMSELGKSISEAASSLASARAKSRASNKGYTHNQSNDNTYLVYTTESDTVERLPSPRSYQVRQNLEKLRSLNSGISSVVKTRLVNSLRAQNRRRWVGGKEEGKINSRQLFKSVLGVDDRVYKQLSDKVQLNTVVMLAIDHSGSMDGDKIQLAAESAVFIGDALNALKVPFAVYGYSTEGQGAAPPPSERGAFARWSKLWIRYYRDFEEAWERGAEKLMTAKNNVQHNTLDSESVKHGIQRLLRRKEKRKILFVFNDGMPYPGHSGHVGRCQQHLKDVVASAAASGIEIVAFGIEDDNVKNYYPNYVVIQNLNDLTLEPLRVLDTMLRKGVTKR